MIKNKYKLNKCVALLTLCLFLFVISLEFTTSVKAQSGTVYTCQINRNYAHPITKIIEDSGGQSSYVTGQGMIEGVVSSQGILEVTDSGEYYLTVRFSLMDYTQNHAFQVQTVNDSTWQFRTDEKLFI